MHVSRRHHHVHSKKVQSSKDIYSYQKLTDAYEVDFLVSRSPVVVKIR